jgi:hypothetical protein
MRTKRLLPAPRLGGWLNKRVIAPQVRRLCGCWGLFAGGVGHLCGTLESVRRPLRDACDFLNRVPISWAKARLVLSRGDYHWQHASCFYAVHIQDKSCL